MTDGNRYIGDRIFDALMEIPGFKEKARGLIEKDWYIGSGKFHGYAQRLIEELPFDVEDPQGKRVVTKYVERRVMENLDPSADPWLWAYFQLTGALIKPDLARFALNAIQNGTK